MLAVLTSASSSPFCTATNHTACIYCPKGMLHRVWRAAAPAAAEARALAWVSWQRGARPSGAAARAAWPSARTHARVFFSGALPNLSPQQVTDTSGRNTAVRCVRCSGHALPMLPQNPKLSTLNPKP